jgi:alkylation response protein AidB-like acyl-CoA dehydrogenase
METKKIAHPSERINKELVDTLRNFSAEAEQIKSLHPEQLSIIYQQGWFKLFVPKIYGGLELPLLEALQIEEVLAWIDGSLGWTVTLCSGANWFVGFIQEKIAKNIFNNDIVCLAGSGKSSGVAKIIDGGYEITGYWNYATGSVHATVFTANCLIEKDGIIVNNEDGTPKITAFLLLKDEVTIHKSWNYIGMIATASNSFEARELKVPADRVFIIDKNYSTINEPIYQYPFLHFAEATLAVNSSGMVHRFLELYENINAASKRKIDLKTILQLDEIKDQFKTSRQNFYFAVQQSWEAHLQNDNTSPEKLLLVSQASRELATKARKLVDDLYPYCGLEAADMGSEINRVWRNFHTAGQHPLLLSYLQ